jgi:hypothetical protein
VTDPLPQEAAPLSEAAVRDMLASAEAGAIDKLVEIMTEGWTVLPAAQNFRIVPAQMTREPFLPVAQYMIGSAIKDAAKDAATLARECLRLRALLAEAAGALGPFAEFAPFYTQEDAPIHASDMIRPGGELCPWTSDFRNAAAVAARVRAHLHPTETPE